MPIHRCLFCKQDRTLSQGILDDLFSQDELCPFCRSALQRSPHKIMLEGLVIESIYVYNEFFARLLLQYKECCDEALLPVFIYPVFSKWKRKVHRQVLVCAPSSKLKTEERGFIPVVKIYESLGTEVQNLFIKKGEVRQFSSGKQERQQIKEQIKLVTKPGVKKVILVDDVCTTGSTLLAMRDELKKEGVECTALCLAIHPLLLRQTSTKRKGILKKVERRGRDARKS